MPPSPRPRWPLWAAILLAFAPTCASLGQAPRVIDATTLHHKVLCGYQGWFRCPGDPSGEGWRHWSRDARAIVPGSLTVEMWPDLSGFADDERFPAPGFTLPDGSPAHLFSSAHPKTVLRHFEWMRDYRIDGVFLQRFLVDVRNPSTDLVLDHVRSSAGATGRIFAVGYDLTGVPESRLLDRLAGDWKRLVEDKKLANDDRYLHHRGKPVVFVWGFYPDRFGPATAHKILDLFQSDGPLAATVIGGCPWSWRSEKDPEWSRAYRRFDVISPWNVANYSKDGDRRQATTGPWRTDLAEAKRSGKDYLSVIYPGFGWTNLKGKRAADATIPRLGGEFFWKQFAAAADLKIDMAYVAMFDEVDEGTAIFKVTNAPPTQAGFATYDGLPSDWYLRLTGEGSKLIRGEIPNRPGLPIRP